MSYKTEQELLNSNQFIIYKMGSLYKSDPNSFKSAMDFIPFFVFTNCRVTKNYLESNLLVKSVIDPDDYLKLKKNTKEYISKRSDPNVFKYAFDKVLKFERVNDYHSICTTYQYLNAIKNDEWFVSNKIIVDENECLNTSYRLPDLGIFGQKITKMLEIIVHDTNSWLKFKQLTKKEKEIIKLIAEGYSNNDISDVLTLSSHTIRTHRERIRIKIDAHNQSQIAKFAQAFDLIGAL